MRCLLLFFFSTAVCFGRLGESYEECAARYGQPVRKVSATAFVFKKSGVFVRVSIGPQGVGRIEYAKEKTGDCVRDALGRDMIIGLLRVNSSTAMHEDQPGVGAIQLWTNADGSVTAVLLRTYPETLQIETASFRAWEAAEQARKAADALPGL